MSTPFAPRICDLSAALGRMDNKLELLEKIVEFFREDFGGLLASLQQAVAAQDMARVQEAAHSLRGLIANFSAEAASQVASRLELMAKSGDLADAPQQLAELEHELTRLDATLTTEMAKLESRKK